MKKLLTVAFALLVVLPSLLNAQTKQWTYKADNGTHGWGRVEVSITITQKGNKYEVSGEYFGDDLDGNLQMTQVKCPILGTYHRNTGKLYARTSCGSKRYDRKVEGFRVGSDRLQISEPFAANAWLNGKKPEKEKGDDRQNESRYIGCFKDSNAPFDLDGFLERTMDNTPEYCVATCRAKGFPYAGVQFGQSCLCGKKYGTQGSAGNCDMKCTGDASKTCGGKYANSVYSTGVTP